MTTHSSFSGFAAQLREFIRLHSCSWERNDGQFLGEEIEFNQLALSLFTLQFTHNAPYRRFCQSRQSAPETTRHWSKIPAIPAAAFKDLDLTSLAIEQRAQVFYSSGTTGQLPSRHFHDAESLALYEASLLPWFQAHLFAAPHPQAPNSRILPGSGPSLSTDKLDCISLTPPPTLAAHSSLAYMFETIQRQLPWRESIFSGQIGSDGAWSLDLDKLLGALSKSVAANRPAMLMGTAFNFVHLLDHLAKTNHHLRLPAGSRVMETGGYKGRSRAIPKSELHALISEWLAIPSSHTVCEYGMSELSSQAYDSTVGFSRGSDRVFRFPPWAKAQIVSPETGHEVAEGETGLIRIFDLANVRSVMAIQTEDLGIRCSDGFELLGRATLAEPRGCSLMAL